MASWIVYISIQPRGISDKISSGRCYNEWRISVAFLAVAFNHTCSLEMVMEEVISLEEITYHEKKVGHYVRNMPFFSDLDADEFSLVTKWFRVYQAEAGDVVFKEGDTSSHLCLVAEGLVSIFKQISDAERLQVAQIKEGGSIGEMGVLDGKPISATAIASVRSIVFIMSGEDFNRLIKENIEIGAKLLLKIGQTISARLRATTSMLAEISISNSDED